MVGLARDDTKEMGNSYISSIRLLTVFADSRPHAQGVRNKAVGHGIFHVGRLWDLAVRSLFSLGK